MFLSENTSNRSYQFRLAAKDISTTSTCKSVEIGTLLDSLITFPFSAGTVLYVTVVNVILAMRINALNRGNRYYGVFLTFLVVGESPRRAMLRLLKLLRRIFGWWSFSAPDRAYNGFHVVLGGFFDMCRHGRAHYS